MKKLLIGIILLVGLSARAQQFPYFNTVDSLKNYINGHIRNDARNAFTNLRLNTALQGIAQFLDSARLAWGGGGGGGAADGNNFSSSLNLNAGLLTLGRTGLSTLSTNIITTHVTEGTKLFFTTARARSSVEQGLYWNYNTSTGVGSVDTAGLFGEIRDTFDTRFGSASLKLEQPNAKKTIATPKVLAVKSLTDFRALTGILATDTEYVFRLTNYTLNYIQDYQYDPNDVTSVDNGATIIKAGTKVFRAIFPTGVVNVKIFGATGNGSTNDQPTIQAAIDAIIANPALPRNLYFPKGSYKIDEPLIVYNWDGTRYQQCNINLIGTEASNWNDLTTVARIIYTGSTKFAIGVHLGRSMKIKGLSIEGSFNPPNGPTNWLAYYKRPWATWASDYGMRDELQSPMTGINIDPFGNENGIVPADGGYPGMSSWYRGDGGASGSSGIVIEECRVRGFTVLIGISISSLTQNAENCVVRNCALTVGKVAIASGQLQTKGNFVYNCISDDRVYSLLSGDYGNGHGCQPYVNGWIAAGDVIQIIHGASAQFPVTFQGIFAESIFRIGDILSGAGETSFLGCNFDFSLFVSPYILPDYHFKGDFVKFKDCTMRFFDDSANHRLYFNGTNLSFDNCFFDKPPLGKYDKGISSSLPQFTFNECRTFNTEMLGFKTLKGRINNPGYKIIKYGQVDIEDAGTLTADDVGLRSLKAHFEFGGMQRFVGVGNTTVTIDTIAHAGSFSVSAGASKVLAVGDYILYGPSVDSVLGRIQSINYSTGAILVTDIPIGPKTATYDMTAAYYNIARGYLVGDVTNGSPTIANVKYGTVLGVPVVGDRSGIGYPETVITAVGGSSLTLSDNAYYTRTQDYRPIDRSEQFEMISYYDLSHANLDGYNFLVPQNATWKIWTSPYTNVQHTYKFTKGGYIHPTTFGQTLQAEWKLTADNNPDAFYINEDKSVHFPAGYANFGATGGSSGYGVRDNAGVMEVKNSGGSWAAFSAATDFYTTDGTLSGNRSVAGNGKSLSLGTGGSNITNLVVNASAATNLFSSLVLGVDVFSSDAIHTVPANVTEVELNDASLTANRVLTLPTATINGTTLIVINKGNNASFFYTFGSTVTDNTTSGTITNIGHRTTYWLHYDSGLGWRIILKY